MVEEGDNASFYCQASGLPTPTLLWKRNNEQIQSGDSRYVIQCQNDAADVTSSTLVVVEVREGDAGAYDVTAVNDAGQASCEAELIGTLPCSSQFA